MGKKSVLSTLRFIFLTIGGIVLIFSAVAITVLNQYKPVVKTYINGEFIGYFSNPQQFDEVYNDLVAEKQNIDPNVKVYLESEPTFETSYIRSNLLEEQNIYTNLRAEVKTEYTIYKVSVNGEEKMTFNTQDDANKYSEDLKKEVAKLNTEIKVEKTAQLGEMTTLERADAILKDIVDRNKPVVTPKVVVSTQTYAKNTYTNNGASTQVANTALAQGGVWPSNLRQVSSSFGYRGDYHTGIDITGSGATGNPIYAYKTGTVTFAGYSSSYGNYIKIDHGNGLATWYAHCSKLLVSAGQEVSQGQTIALIGSTGWVTGPHLHFEVRVNGVPVNPYPYIAGK
ncbi:MAG: peptidoglycan DD-metalloendopeptidase family protein [Clostridia bacterium]|nr:peptidoglycan DD-metalloendopeptidase family protein [Clostridia bacterium]